MIRKLAFSHLDEQPFEQKYIDMVYDLAPKVDTATSSQKDPDNARKSDVSWIDYTEDRRELFEFIFNMASFVNKECNWHFEIGLVEPLQFTEYKQDQRYDWHVDHYLGGVEEDIRKVSFSILLNDEFEGGEFEFELGSPANEERHKTINLKKGDALFFPSYTWHRVKPVTKGVRHSLVGWIRGPQWK